MAGQGGDENPRSDERSGAEREPGSEGDSKLSSEELEALSDTAGSRG